MAVGTFTDLTVTENFADDTKLTEAQLTAANTSIETFCNTTLARNLEQLAKDSWGNANYTFDSDGSANKTNTLFNKQSATDFYNGGNITIGTSADGAYAAVDAVNAALAITPEVIGKYRAVFYFTHRVTSDSNTVLNIDVNFRITDGTDASYAVNSGGVIAAISGDLGEIYNPVFLTYEFDWSTTTAKTITLQKYVRTATNVATNVVSAAAATGEVYMICEKI